MSRGSDMRVALLMMQKNETGLLAPWLAYHGHLCGFESLYIFDNGSTCPEVIALLQQAARAGAHVFHCPGDVETFENKSEILGQTIRELDAKDPRDFYFPMDCDEFLVLKPRFFGEPSCERRVIFRYLSTLRGKRQPLKIMGGYWNLPGRDNWFYFYEHRKVFFARQTFVSMIPGYHRGTTVGGVTQRFETRLAYLHFHNRPFLNLLESARLKMRGRLASYEPKELAGYQGLGNHLIKYFHLNEESYLESFKRRRGIRIHGFQEILSAYGLPVPFSATMPSPTLVAAGSRELHLTP